MNGRHILGAILFSGVLAFSASAVPVIDPIPSATIPAGKSLSVPVTATSPNGRPLTFTATSSTNAIIVQVHTNEPFWKMSIVQAAPSNAPGAFPTPFRGGMVTVTNIGDMTFMLFREYAPHTVDVIQGLTESGLYTSNTVFHRVVPGFVIQGGDPNTNGSGGPVFRYDDEFNPQAIFSGNGQLALANSGKDTDGSQFFVTSGPQRFLDFGYTLFGQLVRGFNVLTNIINTPTNGASRPLADVIITKASFVPDTADTVLTLLSTNVNGVVGTISVIADDGAGGRTTNTFTATSLADTNSNGQAFLYGSAVTNLVGPVNVTLTNVLNAVGLDGETLYWFPQFADQSSYNGASNSTFIITNSVLKTLTYNVTNAQGQLQLFLKSSANYAGPINLNFYVSSNPNWGYYFQNYPPNYWPPYDAQTYSFTFGDTPIVAQATNFTAIALRPFTNQLLATFTNGVPNSPAGNFTAFINWGDNSTNSGVIVNGLNGRKNVLGSHTYTNAGDYPIYLTIQSTVGASTTVVSTASVPPGLNLSRAGGQNVVSWPAWATAYQLQSNTNLSPGSWLAASNYSTLAGYQSVVSNTITGGNLFFRLNK
ncbi:MAG TPA: peptidylprolyl isomerase [Verrucomicrobiae bacterium]|nr:peptidylprolyl isomerase [Verrucomicrobiae bacterium]